MALAVVGTGTGVGKTVVAAAVLSRYAPELPLAYWKPVATGSSDERDAETVRALVGAAVEVLPESYLFRDPVSPHLAARREGVAIEPLRLAADLAAHRRLGRGLVVEGAGGVLVPLGDAGPLLVDAFAGLGLGFLVVATSTLGTINHTLLTLEALRARDVEPVGVVLVGPADGENRAAIERLGSVEVVGELPPLPRGSGGVEPAALRVAARALDPGGRLRSSLTPEPAL